MAARYPLPKLWLVTDPRQGDNLWSALARIPRGGGVIVRHRHLAQADRHMLFDAIRIVARRRRLKILLASESGQAQAWGADGIYGNAVVRRPHHHFIVGATAHNLPEIRSAERQGADFILLSPLFETRSHPDAKPLGRIRFAALIQATHLPVIALGGVGSHHARWLKAIGAHGWAGIDAYVRKTAA